MNAFLAFIGSLAILPSFFSPTTVFEQTEGVYNVIVKNEYQTFAVSETSDKTIQVRSAYSQDQVDVKEKDFNVSREFNKIGHKDWKTSVNNLGFFIFAKNQADYTSLFVEKSNSFTMDVKALIFEAMRDGKPVNMYIDGSKTVKKGRSLSNQNYTIVPFMSNPLFGRNDLVDGSGNTVFSGATYNTSEFHTDEEGKLMYSGSGVLDDKSVLSLMATSNGESLSYGANENGENFLMAGNIFKLFGNGTDGGFGIFLNVKNATFVKNSLYEIENFGENKLLLPPKSSVDSAFSHSCSGADNKDMTCKTSGYSQVYVGDLFNKSLYGIVGAKGTSYYISENAEVIGENSSTVDDGKYLFYTRIFSDPSAVRYTEDIGNEFFVTESDIVATTLAIIRSYYGNVDIYTYARNKYLFAIPSAGVALSVDPASYDGTKRALTLDKYSFDSSDNATVLTSCHSSVDLQKVYDVKTYCEGGFSLVENLLSDNGLVPMQANAIASETYFVVKRGLYYPKMLKPVQAFFAIDLFSTTTQKLIDQGSLLEIDGFYNRGDVLSVEGRNFAVNQLKQYDIYPTIVSDNISFAYDESNIAPFSVGANTIDGSTVQSSLIVQTDGTYRVKFIPATNTYWNASGNGLKIHMNGIKGSPFYVSARFDNSVVGDANKVTVSADGTELTIKNEDLLQNKEGSVSLEVVRKSDNAVINRISLFLKTKGDTSTVEEASYAGFLNNQPAIGEKNILYKNMSSDDQSNYFRVSPFQVDANSFGSAYTKFYKSIRVEVLNENPDQFYIEPILSHEGGVSKKKTIATEDTIDENGKRVQKVFYELRNVRGFPNGSQNTFFMKMKPQAVKTSISANYYLPVTTKITYEYFEGDIPPFEVQKSGDAYVIKYDETGKPSLTYVVKEQSNLVVDLSKNGGQYSSLNLIHPCGYQYPIFNTRYKEDEYTDTTGGDVSCFKDGIQYGYFNLVMTLSKPKISEAKYDSNRVRSMYDGDGDGDGAGFGPGGGTRDYAWAKFPNTLYQYSTTAGRGAADFYDYNDYRWWDWGGYCGVYHENESNFNPLGHVTNGGRLADDNITGKPVVGVTELLFSIKIDSFYKRWHTKEGVDSTPSMLSPIKANFAGDFSTQAQAKSLLGYVKNVQTNQWELKNPDNYLKFPFMMAKDKDTGIEPLNSYVDANNATVLSQGWKTKFNQKGAYMGASNGEIYFQGNSSYIKYDLDSNVMKQGVYKDGFEIHMPAWMNGAVDKVYLIWEDELTNEGIYMSGSTSQSRQGWFKKNEYISVRMVLKDANPSVVKGQMWQERIKNSVEDMVKIVWPITSPGYVSVMTNVDSELNANADFPTIASVINGVYVLKNALRDNGLLRYKTYFNAKQSYATNYRVGHMEHITYWGGRYCDRRYDTHIPHFSYGYHVFNDGYYYDGTKSGTNNVVDPMMVNSDYLFMGGPSGKGLKLKMKQQDLFDSGSTNIGTFLSTSEGNYFIRFQTANQNVVYQGPRFVPESKKPTSTYETSTIDSNNDKGVIYLKDTAYETMKNMLFDGDVNLHKPSIRDYFMNNSKITIVNSTNSLENDVIDSYKNDNLREDEIKVFYYGTKNVSIQKDITLAVCDGRETQGACAGKAYGDGFIGVTDFSTGTGGVTTFTPVAGGSFKGLRVFITDGDVMINGNVKFGMKIGENAYGPIIVATGKSKGNVYVGSRPDIFEGLIVANNMVVDYNYKMFMVNGGALIRNADGAMCNRYALQTPEVFSNDTGNINGGVINLNSRAGYEYRLRNSCVVLNNTKFSNFTLRKELGTAIPTK